LSGFSEREIVYSGIKANNLAIISSAIALSRRKKIIVSNIEHFNISDWKKHE